MEPFQQEITFENIMLIGAFISSLPLCAIWLEAKHKLNLNSHKE